MSEWYDSQKKPNGDFHRLLQDRLEKSNPRGTELTTDEKKRLAKLGVIVGRLTRRENVQKKPLKLLKLHDFTLLR
jgi:hypothetical protein